MSGGIFLLSGENLVEMREQAYDSEDLLQAWLAKYPNLLAGEQLAGSPRRWLTDRSRATPRVVRPDDEAGHARPDLLIWPHAEHRRLQRVVPRRALCRNRTPCPPATW